MAPSPESIWFIAWPSFLFPFFPPSLSLFKYPDFFDALLLYFSLPLNISRCRNANMKLWTSGTIEQRPELLSAFMAEGNISAPLLYCHWVHLFVFSLLSTQNLYKFTLKHLFTGQNPSHIHPVFFKFSFYVGLTSSHPQRAASPFRSLHEKLCFVLQSHYVCNWISVEPFRAVWLSY